MLAEAKTVLVQVLTSVALLGAGVPACSSKTSAQLAPKTCTPGEREPCFGDGDCSGVKTCNAEGRGFGACECGDGGHAGAGGGAGASGAAGSGGAEDAGVGGQGGSSGMGGMSGAAGTDAGGLRVVGAIGTLAARSATEGSIRVFDESLEVGGRACGAAMTCVTGGITP